MNRKEGETITEIERRILMAIVRLSRAEEPTPISSLAIMCEVTPTTIRNYLRGFEQGGYITRTRRATNSSHVIAITESGRSALKAAAHESE